MESTDKTARLAGLAYLLLGITSAFGLLCAPLAIGDPKALANTIASSERLFHVAIACDLFSHVCSISLVLLLYQMLKSIDKKLAGLMVILLLISVPISFMITLNDMAAQILLSDTKLLAAFTRPQLEALALVFLRLHIQGIFAVEIFWGLWLFPFGALVMKSNFFPRILGIFLVIAGIAYVVHCFVSLLLPGSKMMAYQVTTMVARAFGELPIMFWLLIKGSTYRRSLHATNVLPNA
jgi:Domain of unknown function (DUF4386)